MPLRAGRQREAPRNGQRLSTRGWPPGFSASAPGPAPRLGSSSSGRRAVGTWSGGPGEDGVDGHELHDLPAAPSGSVRPARNPSGRAAPGQGTPTKVDSDPATAVKDVRNDVTELRDDLGDARMQLEQADSGEVTAVGRAVFATGGVVGALGNSAQGPQRLSTATPPRHRVRPGRVQPTAADDPDPVNDVTDSSHPTNYRFTARGRLVDEVHLVDAPVDVVAFPSAYRTHCGQEFVETFQDGRPATCPGCARSAGGAPASSNTSNVERRTGEHVR
jgi:hypothetical protein